jgi:hypothetical protein
MYTMMCFKRELYSLYAYVMWEQKYKRCSCSSTPPQPSPEIAAIQNGAASGNPGDQGEV